MFGSIVPVNLARHGKTTIKPIDSYPCARNVHMVVLMIQEFALSAASYPIVFVEKPGGSDFLAVALLGFTPGENLFLDEQGKWTVPYIPAMIRRYPFTLAETGEDGRFSVCVDETSDLVTTENGARLFDGDGRPSETLERVKRFLIELQQMETVTNAFCRKLREWNLLAPLNLRITEAGAARNVSGCYVVNEDRLNSLPDDIFLEFRKSQYLLPIYSHLISLPQIGRLITVRSNRPLPQSRLAGNGGSVAADAGMVK